MRIFLIYFIDGDTFIVRRTVIAKRIVAVDIAIVMRIVAIAAVSIVVCVKLSFDVENFRGDFGLPKISSCFGSMLGVEPRSFFSTPFCAYEYQNRACFYTHGLRIFDYHQSGCLFFWCILVLHLGYGIEQHMDASMPVLQ